MQAYMVQSLADLFAQFDADNHDDFLAYMYEPRWELYFSDNTRMFCEA